MKRAVRVSEQVAEFQSRLAPEPRKAFKRALGELQSGGGGTLPLEAELAGSHRLRIGRHRVIFAYAGDGAIDALFVADRSIVYDVFEAEFIRRITQPEA